MASLLSYALTNVADVKESLGIVSSDASWDNLITRKINQVTRQIENYCGRRFASTSYAEEYAGSLIDQMVLNQRPVTALTSLEVRDGGLNINNWEPVDSQIYFLDSNAGMLNLLFKAPGHWNRYRVTYTAGYATIPEDLAEAAITLTCFYVNNADGGAAFIQDKQEGQRRIRYSIHPKSFYLLLQELGLDQIIDSYANLPLLADR